MSATKKLNIDMKKLNDLESLEEATVNRSFDQETLFT